MTGRAGRRRDAVISGVQAVRGFYRRPVAWVALLVSSALLTFGGGVAMFWFHAIVRGEQGPAIGDVHHWLLDSSLGFVALTPVLALILPLGVWAAGNAAGPDRRGLRAYVVAVAALFTLTTGPGPFLHNLVAGSGTPLARLATDVFGHDATVAARNMHVHDRSPLAEGALQILVGFPVYVAGTWLSLVLVRGMVGRGRRRPADEMGAAAGRRKQTIHHRSDNAPPRPERVTTGPTRTAATTTPAWPNVYQRRKEAGNGRHSVLERRGPRSEQGEPYQRKP